jgi:Family of unknown function (DUF5641)
MIDESRPRRGPPFLAQDFISWPVKPASLFASSETKSTSSHLLHIVRNKFNYDHMMLNPKVFDSIKPRSHSRWSSRVRVSAFMLRIVDIRVRMRTFLADVISPEHLRAEFEMLRKVQLDAFEKEVKHCSQHGPDRLNRMRSRSTRARLSHAATNPPILLNNHPLVNVFIRCHHERNFQIGPERTITVVRETDWVIDTRSAVQRVTPSCARCNLEKAKLAMPLMGSLPAAREDFVAAPPLSPASSLYAHGREHAPKPRSPQRTSVEFSCRKSRRADHLASTIHRWTRECLPEITSRSRNFEPIKPIKPVTCDDIATLIDPLQPKAAWNEPGIVQVHPRANETIRTEEVMLPDHTVKTGIVIGRSAVLIIASSPPAEKTARGLWNGST